MIVSSNDTCDFPPIVPQVARQHFEPSDQQAAIIAHVTSDAGHVEGIARAGTGKTSTICEAFWRLADQGVSSVYACFNAHVKKEFQGRLPARSRAATLNGLGYQLLLRQFGSQLDEHKVDRIAERYFPGNEQRATRRSVVQIADLCRATLIDPEDTNELACRVANFGIEIPPGDISDVLGIMPTILDDCLENTATVDFADQIWMPVRLGLKANVAQVLAIDEAQDLNAAQHSLVRLLCPDGQVIVIGDPRQAIYGWRGADVRSMDTLRAALSQDGDSVTSYPITVTRRCPKKVVLLARQIVPDLDYHSAAADGVVDCIKEDQIHALARPGDMILCRKNAPMVSVAYRFIRSGRKAVVRGRDIGKGLVLLLARLRARTVGDLLRRIEEHKTAELINLSMLRNPENAIQSLIDKCDCLISLADGATSVDEIRHRAETIFADTSEKGAVILSSVHRAKGLEADRIFILQPDCLPGPWAKQPDDQLQELNLLYVAMTRSKHDLFFCGDVPAVLC